MLAFLCCEAALWPYVPPSTVAPAAPFMTRSMPDRQGALAVYDSPPSAISLPFAARNLQR